MTLYQAALTHILAHPQPHLILETPTLAIRVHETLYSNPLDILDDDTGEYPEFPALAFYCWHRQTHQAQDLAAQWCRSLGLRLDHFNHETLDDTLYIPLAELALTPV